MSQATPEPINTPAKISAETNKDFLVSFPTREGEYKQGPLDFMWGLIQKYEVDIFEVSLTRIINDFLNHINRNLVALEQKSVFSYMAARLILYKSKCLLPVFEEDIPNDGLFDTLPPDLIDRLLEYKKLQVAAEYLSDIQSISQTRFTKKPEWQNYEKEIDFFKLDLVAFLRTFQKYLLKNESTQDQIFHIEEEEIQVEELQKWLYKRLLVMQKLSFFHLVKEASLLGIISFFLAILELGKQNIITMHQDESKDIIIELK